MSLTVIPAAWTGPIGLLAVSNANPSSGALSAATYFGYAVTWTSCPLRRTTIWAGVAARHPFVSEPAQRWLRIWFRILSGEPLTPSTDTSWSPGLSTSAAGVPRLIAPTFLTATCWPWLRSRIQMIKNAIIRLTNGPARITTIRFHTGWL